MDVYALQKMFDAYYCGYTYGFNNGTDVGSSLIYSVRKVDVLLHELEHCTDNRKGLPNFHRAGGGREGERWEDC